MLTPEQQEIRALAREFAETELRPHTERWDHDRAMDASVVGTLGEMGLLGLRVPEQFGGLGLDVATFAVAVTEISWGEASVGLLLLVHNGPVVELLVRYGTDDQKAQTLPALASGELVGALAIAEPNAGSDVENLETRAVRTTDGWQIRGAKRWVTNGRQAGVVITIAQTGDGPTAFLLSPDMDGYTVAADERTMGMRASETVSLDLDVTVGDAAVLGEVGKAMEYIHQAGVLGRIGVAAQATGIARAALEHAVRYAGEREQFGQPIAQFGAIQEKLASMACAVDASQALVLDVARRVDAGETTGEDQTLGIAAAAAAAKAFASESAMTASDEAVQIFGGYGYMRDYPVEKLMRDAKGTEIYEGTTQVLRASIAHDLMSQQAATSGA